jgi:hypothetical protein
MMGKMAALVIVAAFVSVFVPCFIRGYYSFGGGCPRYVPPQFFLCRGKQAGTWPIRNISQDTLGCPFVTG